MTKTSDLRTSGSYVRICPNVIIPTETALYIVENEGLFYMIHGNITYVDEALYEDKLSTVFDDLGATRETQDRVHEFVRNHPTVYCGTHRLAYCTIEDRLTYKHWYCGHYHTDKTVDRLSILFESYTELT